jgi:arylsulfatase A-like enzyme
VASLLTSRAPRSHGVSEWEHRLPKQLTTLAQHLRGAGYRTEAYVSHHALAPSFSRFQRGFDVYDISSFNERGSPHDISSARQVSDSALESLRTMEDPFFLWLHYFDPHQDYLHHPKYDFGAADIDRYDSEIAHTDQQLGRVLNALRESGRLKDTVVVLTADHGEEFLDHGSQYHAHTLYDEVLRVPLVIHAPGLAPAFIARTVGLMDVAPTILSLAGVPQPEQFEGTPIPVDDGRLVLREDRAVIAETRHQADKRGIVWGRWKLIQDRVAGEWALFDLEQDPREVSDVLEGHPDVVALLKKALRQAELAPGAAADVGPMSDEYRRVLEALGYTK